MKMLCSVAEQCARFQWIPNAEHAANRVYDMFTAPLDDTDERGLGYLWWRFSCLMNVCCGMNLLLQDWTSDNRKSDFQNIWCAYFDSNNPHVRDLDGFVDIMLFQYSRYEASILHMLHFAKPCRKRIIKYITNYFVSIRETSSKTLRLLCTLLFVADVAKTCAKLTSIPFCALLLQTVKSDTMNVALPSINAILREPHMTQLIQQMLEAITQYPHVRLENNWNDEKSDSLVRLCLRPNSNIIVTQQRVVGVSVDGHFILAFDRHSGDMVWTIPVERDVRLCLDFTQNAIGYHPKDQPGTIVCVDVQYGDIICQLSDHIQSSILSARFDAWIRPTPHYITVVTANTGSPICGFGPVKNKIVPHAFGFLDYDSHTLRIETFYGTAFVIDNCIAYRCNQTTLGVVWREKDAMWLVWHQLLPIGVQPTCRVRIPHDDTIKILFVGVTNAVLQLPDRILFIDGGKMRSIRITIDPLDLVIATHSTVWVWIRTKHAVFKITDSITCVQTVRHMSQMVHAEHSCVFFV